MAVKILIVDDDEFTCTVTQVILEQCGYTVEIATDGLAGWDRINSQPTAFDLMLLDKKMPKMNGIALLKRLRSDKRFKDLPVIMLTGDGRQDDILEGLAAGASYYLIRPSSSEILKLIIQNALAEYEHKRELIARIGKQTGNLNLLHKAQFRYRTLSEARDLALLLAEASQDPARTVNGYSELLINAIEHGNLGISYAEKSRLLVEDRWEDEISQRLNDPAYAGLMVEVTLEKTPFDCLVTITDQGCGFDWQAYMEFSPERVFDLHGRGIAMSKAASFDSMEYEGKGNRVLTSVRFAG